MSAQQLRRGLPRVSGGSAWPVGEGNVSAPAAVQPVATVADTSAALTSSVADVTSSVSIPEQIVQQGAPVVAAAISGRELRRGLPRTGGGEPWPAGSVVSSGSAAKPAQVVESAAAPAHGAPVVENVLSPAMIAPAPAAATAEGIPTNDGLRRGLPRTHGGSPWPLPGARPNVAIAPESVVPPTAAAALDVVAVAAPVPATAAEDVSAATHIEPPAQVDKPRVPLKDRISGLPLLSKVLLASAAFLVLAAVVVIIARLLISTPAGQSFLSAYPGETELPEAAPVGFPLWLGWQHFFNVFLMVLIIRSGLTVRREQRPGSYWAPKKNPTRKVSLMVWFHQTLDVLWLVNGVAFIVLLFVTGQWMRIVPTSWDVIPNAVSAALQYASFDWPTENGWVNYNSLQVLAYFTTVFLAAPLAAITGFRMSTMWPQNAKKLSAVYPMEWARAIHFPVMLYFCGFIVVHVFLVFATGALRNLNHMYGNSDVVDWTGLGIFVASLVVIAVAWVFARPIIIAPLASKFGSVTSR